MKARAAAGRASDLALGRNRPRWKKLERALAAKPGSRSRPRWKQLGSAYLASGRLADAERSLAERDRPRAQDEATEHPGGGAHRSRQPAAAQGRLPTQPLYREAASWATNDCGAGRDQTLRAPGDDGRRAEALGMLPPSPSKCGRFRLAHKATPRQRRPAYVKLGDGARGASVLREALAASEAANDARARSAALGYLAELYEGGRRQEALQLRPRAIVAAEDAGAPELLFPRQWHRRGCSRAQASSTRRSWIRHAVTPCARASAIRPRARRVSFRESVGPPLPVSDLCATASIEAVVDATNALGRLRCSSGPNLLVHAAPDTMEILKGRGAAGLFPGRTASPRSARARTGIDAAAARATAAIARMHLADACR